MVHGVSLGREYQYLNMVYYLMYFSDFGQAPSREFEKNPARNSPCTNSACSPGADSTSMFRGGHGRRRMQAMLPMLGQPVGPLQQSPYNNTKIYT